MTPLLIMAAGQSSRMRGSDKLSEIVSGQPLLRLQALRAIATGQPVYVCLPDRQHPRANQLADLDLTIIAVPDAADGMAASLRRGVEAIPPGNGFMILLADLVDILPDDITALLQARDAHPRHLIWRAATPMGQPGHPVLCDDTLRPSFLGLTGDAGGNAPLKAQKDATYLVRLDDDRARRDLDTPEAWAAWRQRQIT